MTGSTCAVSSCRNKSNNKPNGVVFHTAGPAVRLLWAEKCGQPSTWIPPKSLTVCSNHFDSNGYKIDLRNKLLNLPERKMLKETAVPSLELGNLTVTEMNKLPFTFPEQRCNLPNESSIDPTVLENEIPSVTSSPDQEIERLKAEFADLQKSSAETIQDLENQKKTLKKLLEDANESIKRLTTDKLYMKAAFEKYKNCPKNISKAEKIKIIQEALHGILTKNQIEIMCGHKKYAHWSNDELQTAFTLRYMGKRAYKFVTKVMLIPLPSLSKLHRWASKLDIQCGNLNCVLNVMKCTAPSFEEAERVAVITFDEMKTRKQLEIDQKHDKIVGPHTHMQVAMVRGVFGRWKVYLDFDQKMTPEILMEIITKMHEVGYVVHAASSDMGGGNQGLLRDLGISHEKTWIPHPVDPNVKIFFFADAPHCLKLTRNWLLDTGFVLNDGSIVDKKPLEALVKLVASPQCPLEVTSCYKLTEAHIKCEKTSRQSVRLAAELISHSTEVALQRYLPGNDPEAALRLSKVIGTINGWFDVFNSYILYSTPLKSAYGTHLVEQEKCLDDMYFLISTMRCGEKTFLQVFQKAIMISIKSLQMLRIELGLSFGKKFILTHRLNQDLLENFVSQIRTRGGLHDHPTPLEALWRVRMIILGKNSAAVQANNNANALEQSKSDGDQFLTASALTILEEALIDEPPEPDEPSEGNDCLEENVDLEVDCAVEDDNNDMPPPPNYSDLQEEMKLDGIEFLAGWVAYKFKKEYSYLGHPTRESKQSISQLPSWVQQLSFGGLIEPTPEWLEQAHSIEKQFQAFHGHQSIFKGPNVVKSCVNLVLQEVSGVPEKIIRTYVLQRTRIRVKYLNAYASYKEEQERIAKEEEKRLKEIEKEEEKRLKEIEKKRREEEKITREEEKKKLQEEQKLKKAEQKAAKAAERQKKQEDNQKKRAEEKAAKEEEKKKRQEELKSKRAEELAAKEEKKRRKVADRGEAACRKRKIPITSDDPVQRKKAKKYNKLVR